MSTSAQPQAQEQPPSQLLAQTPNLLSSVEIKQRFWNWLLRSAVIVTESAKLARFHFKKRSDLKGGATAHYLMAATGLDAINKSKQHGFSTLLILWWYFLASSFDNLLLLHVSRDTKQNQIFLNVAKTIHEHAISTDEWERPNAKFTEHEIEFPARSSVQMILPPVIGVGRGLPIAGCHISELPWMRDISEERKKEIVVGIMESLRPFGVLVLESTPRMIGDTFGTICNGTDPDIGRAFKVHTYDWRWKWFEPEARRALDRLGPRLFAREHDCSFTQSGSAVFESVPDVGGLAEPDPDGRFWKGCDPAGGGEDRTVLRVIDPETGLGYHECGRWSYDGTAERMAAIDERYPGRWLIELSGGFGDALSMACRDRGVELAHAPPEYAVTRQRAGRRKPGLTVTAQNKPRLVRLLDDHLRSGWLLPCADCERLELLEYAYKPGGGTEAPSGRHDDHVAADYLALAAGQVRAPQVRVLA